jgi:hypothetical protein
VERHAQGSRRTLKRATSELGRTKPCWFPPKARNSARRFDDLLNPPPTPPVGQLGGDVGRPNFQASPQSVGSAGRGGVSDGR